MAIAHDRDHVFIWSMSTNAKLSEAMGYPLSEIADVRFSEFAVWMSSVNV